MRTVAYMAFNRQKAGICPLSRAKAGKTNHFVFCSLGLECKVPSIDGESYTHHRASLSDS
jgi:hypothetical protein